jgi:hypothetical protein
LVEFKSQRNKDKWRLLATMSYIDHQKPGNWLWWYGRRACSLVVVPVVLTFSAAAATTLLPKRKVILPRQDRVNANLPRARVRGVTCASATVSSCMDTREEDSVDGSYSLVGGREAQTELRARSRR